MNHRKNAGVNTNADISQCMVVGCGRRALYRNAASNRINGTQRGYCREHKQLATESQKSAAMRTEWVANHAGKR